MEVLGVGPIEFLFIVIIALIVLGPKDMKKAGRTLGEWLNKLIHSDTWKIVRKTSDELRHLPTRLMRESNYEKYLAEIEGSPQTQEKTDAWSGKPGGQGSTPPRSHSIEGREIPPAHSKSKTHPEETPARKHKTAGKAASRPKAKKPSPAPKTAAKPPKRVTRKKPNA